MDAFAEHQRQTAAALGYGQDVDAMNADHDPLHLALCRWLGIVSHAMRDADGEALTEPERALAAMEEDAVLKVQRLMRSHGVKVPGG